MTYQLDINEKEARTIAVALELMARIGMGQITEIIPYVPARYNNPELFSALEDAAPLATGLEGRHTYYGILNEAVHEQSRLARDLYKIIRHRLAWDRNPDGGIQVDFDDPKILQAYGTNAQIKRVSDD